MPAVIVALLGIIGDLVKRGAEAYADAQKQHDDLVAAVETGLTQAQAALAQMKSDHAARMAAAQAAIDAAQKSS